MKLLLTSAGVKNPTIHRALVAMLPKPLDECAALCVPTAMYANPGGALHAAAFISGRSSTPMVELGWKSVGVLELTALPSIDETVWRPMVEEADILLVGGGDAVYLSHWMRLSGLADLFLTMPDTVYMGLSAGSMVMTPSIGVDFMRWQPPTGGDTTLGIVPFSIFPHLDHVNLPENTTADAEAWAATMPQPCYAIDDETAIAVVDDEVTVATEGHWALLNA